jgi:anti-sigma B factor antagonist
MAFHISVQHHGACTWIQVDGEIDLATCPRLQTVLADLADHGFHQLIVDLERVGFLDCTGLGVLVGAEQRARARGGFLKLARPQPLVDLVLTLTEMRTVFPIDTSLEEPATEPVGRRMPV